MILCDDTIELQDAVTKVGTSGANWLKIPCGTRGIGMGGSQVASGRGLSGAYFNPAAIAYIESSEAYFSKSNYLAGITHNTLGYGTRLTPTDYFGLHMFYLDSGQMEVTSVQTPDGIGEYFNVLDLSLRLIYAKQLTDRLRVGGAVKYIREEIYTTYMQSFVFDLGSNFDTGVYGIILGMSVSNFGPDIQFQGEGLQVESEDDVSGYVQKITKPFSVPLVFRLGIQKDLFDEVEKGDDHLIVSIDAINPIDYELYSCMGIEYAWHNMAFVRSGLLVNHDRGIKGYKNISDFIKNWEGEGLSVGAGIKWKIIMVDYAYVNNGHLETTHQFGISLEF